MIKIFESYYKIFESITKLRRLRLNDIYYHGWGIDRPDDDEEIDLWEEFDTSYSDYSAVWVTDREEIAIEFSDWKGADIRVVYKVKVKTFGIAEIDYNESQDLIEYFGLSDFREIIDILMRYGYRGWSTPGSIDAYEYDDIALFYPDEQIQILEAMVSVDGEEWTDYMSLEQAKEYINGNVIV